MIVTRGLGRSGSPSRLVTSGLGLGVLLELLRDEPLATITLDATDLVFGTDGASLELAVDELETIFDLVWEPALRIEVRPPVTDFVVVDPTLMAKAESPDLTMDLQEEGLAVDTTPIQTSVDTQDEPQAVDMLDPELEVGTEEDDELLLETQPVELVIISLTDDLEMFDDDQLLVADTHELEMSLSTTPLEGQG